MEYVAVHKSGVGVFTFTPGEELPSEPNYTFPPVFTAEGCVWSPDGSLLGLVDGNSGGVVVYDASQEYSKLCEIPPLIGGPVRCFYFSPQGNHVVTYERWLKDAGNNVGLWDARTGEMRWSFLLKKFTEMNWPPLKWTALETHCCRMVADGVQIMPGTCQKDELIGRIAVPNIMAFEVSPKGVGGGSPSVAVCTPESKGAPARCQIYSVDNPSTPTAAKSFYKVQKVIMKWNNMGSALLVLTSMDVDDTGKAYYGSTNLYFMRPDGSEDCMVANAGDGPVHDVEWSPLQDEFMLLHGDLPCTMKIHDGKKAAMKMEFGTGHRNTIRWNTFGRFVVLGGFGQLVGDVDFWDRTGKQKMGSIRMECCVTCGWGPDGRHFLSATTSPRMRVDNKIEIWDYCGNRLCTTGFEELLLAEWRPGRRGAFKDRPPSPGRKGPDSKTAGGKAAPKKQAYRPPGARGAGGGLSDLLRKELGSTSAETNSTATKIFAGKAPMPQNVPGAAPVDAAGQAANSRNARRKKAKESAAAQAEADAKDKLAAALAASTKVEFTPPARAAAVEEEPAEKAAATQGRGEAEKEAGPSDANPEVEKKIRALKKKLRDIDKLKEKPAKDLDPLQKEKIAGEAALLNQVADRKSVV